jgi:hypothetical protein
MSGDVSWEKPAKYVMAADDLLMGAAIRIQSRYRARRARRDARKKVGLEEEEEEEEEEEGAEGEGAEGGKGKKRGKKVDWKEELKKKKEEEEEETQRLLAEEEAARNAPWAAPSIEQVRRCTNSYTLLSYAHSSPTLLSYTLLSSTPLLHSSPTLLSYTLLSYTPLLHTPLLHSSPTLLSYTPLLHSSPTHSSPTLLSYTPLIHSSPTLLSYTPLIHSSPSLLSYTALIHSSPTRRSARRSPTAMPLCSKVRLLIDPLTDIFANHPSPPAAATPFKGGKESYCNSSWRTLGEEMGCGMSLYFLFIQDISVFFCGASLVRRCHSEAV